MAEAIRLNSVSVNFGDHIVHRDISFEVEQGEVVTLLGPSGTGKTVLLRLMIGLLAPTSGQVFVLNRLVPELNDEELQDLRRDIGMLFQGAALFDSLSVYENIAYPLRERGERSEQIILKTVKDTLDLIGLPDIEHKFPGQLSGGQKKRVGLARALASSPRIVLFDEPTTGLDPTAIRLIDDLILELKERFGMTSVIVTHDIESAKRISDRLILINNGQVVAQGPVAQVIETSPDVRAFVSGNWQE